MLLRASKREGKPCEVCRREFFRRVNSDQTVEAPGAFARRRFCSRTCCAISRERDKRAGKETAQR